MHTLEKQIVQKMAASVFSAFFSLLKCLPGTTAHSQMGNCIHALAALSCLKGAKSGLELWICSIIPIVTIRMWNSLENTGIPDVKLYVLQVLSKSSFYNNTEGCLYICQNPHRSHRFLNKHIFCNDDTLTGLKFIRTAKRREVCSPAKQ